MEEKIIKKEDKLTYKGGFVFNDKKGSLVLTQSQLYFLSGDKKVFEIPINSVINVRAKKGLGNGIDHLLISYQNGQKEQQIKIEHFAFWSGTAIGNLSQLKEPYFKSWEQIIEDMRLGKTNNKNDFSDLEKLAELKNKGIISEEEFSAKKKQLLGL